GKRNFGGNAGAGAIKNEGTINAGSNVFLIASSVENSGIITSPKGDVVLAAGHTVQLVDSNNPDLHVVVSAPENKAVNLGQVIAQGGRIGIYGALVNQRGTLNANSAVMGANGKIVLKASGDTLLEAGSVTTATGAGQGGSVHVLGQRVAVGGTVDASGAAGGGTVLVGGDYQGKNAALPNAQQTVIGRDAVLRADATASGDGGKVIAWSDQATQVAGTLSARGGAAGGNGGLIETSGHALSVQDARVDAGAAQGRRGTWLLDPNDIVVANSGTSGVGDLAFASSPTGTITVAPATLVAANADVMLQAYHDITFSDALALGAHQLTAQAGNNITLNADVSTTGGAIKLSANDAAGTVTGSGTVTVNHGLHSGGAAISLSGAGLVLGSSAVIDSTASSASNDISLKADTMNIDSAARITAGAVGTAGIVSLTPFTSSRTINITDSVTQAVPSLLLGSAQLSTIQANELNIGGAGTSGAINWGLSTPFASTALKSLVLESTGNVNVSGAMRLANTGGTIVLGTYGNGAITVNANGSVIAPNVFLRSNNMTLGGAVGTLDSTTYGYVTGQVQLMPYDRYANVALGQGAADAPNMLGLDDAELNLVKASTVTVGRSDLGSPIAMGAASLNVPYFVLSSGNSSISVTGALTNTGKIGLSAQNVIDQTSSGVITTPALYVEGVGGNTTVQLTSASNMVGSLTGTAAGYLGFKNGTDLTLGDASKGVTVVASSSNAFPTIDVTAHSGSSSTPALLTVANAVQATDGSVLLTGDNLAIGQRVDRQTSSGGSSSASVQGSLINLTTGGTLSVAAGAQVSATNAVSVAADRLVLETGSNVTATGSIDLTTVSASRDIQLGGTDDGTKLTVLQSDLAALHASSLLMFGSGNVSVAGSVNLGVVGGLSEALLFAGWSNSSSSDPSTTPTTSTSSTSGTVNVASGASISAPLLGLLGGQGVNISGSATGTTALYLGSNGAVAVNGSASTSTSGGTLYVSGAGIGGAGSLSGYSIELASTAGIGSATAPLHTVAGVLSANNTQTGSAPISIVNNSSSAPASLIVTSLTQAGTGNGGAISLDNYGAMNVGSGSSSGVVSAQTGAVSLVTHSPLDVYGTISTSGGDVSLVASGTGDLTLHGSAQVTTSGTGAIALQAPGGNITLDSTVHVATASGALSLTAGGTITAPTGTVTSTSGTVQQNGTTTNSTTPTLSQCLAAPSTAGCTTILAAALDACVANPSGADCASVLPKIDTCVAAPTTAGCSVVLPKLDTCIAAPTTAGCSVVLPTIDACTAAPATNGCTVVLPKIDICIATPTAAGCSVVLPKIDVCIATPTAAGCSVVLPKIETCIASPAAAGCSVVLPKIETCIATPAAAGCSVVLPKVETCIATPTAAGCSVVLPKIEACIAAPTTAGCSVVLPKIEACIAAPTTSGCSVVLPKVEACIAAPTTSGCSVVLPKLEACIAAPATNGCAVVLPKIETCLTAPATAGCVAVLPSIAQCVANKGLNGCTVVLPALDKCVANPTVEGCVAVLPSLAECVAAPSAKGCGVVLPTLAECTTSPSLPGCAAVLPSLAQCAASPTLAGCSAVLPTLAQCTATPTLPGCQAVLPATSTPENKPVTDAVNTTVNVVVQSTTPVPVAVTLPAAKPPAPPAPPAPAAASGSGSGAGADSTSSSNSASSSNAPTSSSSSDNKSSDKADDKKTDDKKDATAPADSGVKKNDAPAPKTYCN
ncbi:MAG: beta strand repeat-containing protein, partial [Telluria sp.]